MSTPSDRRLLRDMLWASRWAADRLPYTLDVVRLANTNLNIGTFKSDSKFYLRSGNSIHKALEDGGPLPRPYWFVTLSICCTKQALEATL